MIQDIYGGFGLSLGAAQLEVEPGQLYGVMVMAHRSDGICLNGLYPGAGERCDSGNRS